MSKEFKKKSEQELSAGETATEEQVGFADWFSIRLRDHKKLQAHHYNSILTYFKNKGLNEREQPQEFDSMLKEFGF